MVAEVFAVLVLFTLFFFILSIPVGFYTAFATTLSNAYNYASYYPLFLFVGPIGVYLPGEQNLGLLFVVFTSIYAAMMALAAFQGRSIPSALKAASHEGVGAILSNYLLVTVVAVGFLTFTASVVDIFVTTAGVPIGSLSGDAYLLFMSLAVAPLREEVGFRLVLIGIPALALAIGLPAKSYLKTLWRPSVILERGEWNTEAKFLLGVTIAISAIVFGIAHIDSASGWAIGKLPEAAYAGVVLGYLYVRYGLHVAVLTHWAFDYVSSVYAFFGQGVFGIPWTSSPGYWLENVYLFEAFYLIGLASFLVVAYVGLKSFASRRAQASGALA